MIGAYQHAGCNRRPALHRGHRSCRSSAKLMSLSIRGGPGPCVLHCQGSLLIQGCHLHSRGQGELLCPCPPQRRLALSGFCACHHVAHVDSHDHGGGRLQYVCTALSTHSATGMLALLPLLKIPFLVVPCAPKAVSRLCGALINPSIWFTPVDLGQIRSSDPQTSRTETIPHASMHPCLSDRYLTYLHLSIFTCALYNLAAPCRAGAPADSPGHHSMQQTSCLAASCHTGGAAPGAAHSRPPHRLRHLHPGKPPGPGSVGGWRQCSIS